MEHEIASAAQRKNAEIRVSAIPFSRLPGQSKLFLDYLSGPVSLRRYYPNVFETPRDAAGFADVVISNYRTDRSALSQALWVLNDKLGAPQRTLDNIKRLADPDCIAVVTGQQTGLFTGPLYTIYKALTAIRLAEELRSKNINAVPVFWAASEDHDFAEVSHASFRGRAGTSRVSYDATDVDALPVGRVRLDESIDSSVDAAARLLADGQFADSVRADLKDAWRGHVEFSAAFERSLLQLLGKFGLIVVDPLDPAIKQLCAPIYVEAIAKAATIVDAIRQRSSALVSDGYHAQVLVEEDYFPLFWHDDAGHRLALRKVGESIYRVKGDKREFTLGELSEMAAREPERFSPGVMLRPVVQDYLLPTLCYFGGGAEIAYFAQNSETYRLLDRPVTPIFHRQSFTVVEARQHRTLKRLGLELPDLFEGRETLRLRIAESEFQNETGRIFAEVEETVNAQLNRLDQRLSGIDPTLAKNLATRRRKIIYHIGAMRNKTLLAEARKHEVLGERLDDLFTALLPDGQLQERVLNVYSFIAKHGNSFIDWLYGAVDLDDKQHRILNLS